MSLARTRTLFLRMIALSYTMAFSGLYTQIRGLYGENGLSPARNELDALLKSQNIFSVLVEKPTFLWFAPDLMGLSTELTMELFCLVGLTLGSLITFFPSIFAGKIGFFLLWSLYLSLYTVGGTFMHFQWDTLLLETGVLSIVMAPMKSSDASRNYPWDVLGLYNVRWLLFRMMLNNGVVKLSSGCPRWWSLTAMPLHYESQCLPTSTSRFFHNSLPISFHKLSVILTFFLEIPFPFLFYGPTKLISKLVFLSQISLMIMIMVTGNFNFFNFLYMALCVSLMKDEWWTSKIKNGILSFLTHLSLSLLLVSGFLLYFVDSKKSSLSFSTEFTNKDFSEFTSWCYHGAILLGALSLLKSMISSFLSLPSHSKGCLSFFANSMTCIFYGLLSTGIFLHSLPVFSDGMEQHLPSYLPMSLIKGSREIGRALETFQMTHSYGLFRQMTGWGGRPEVILEGSHDASSWKEFHFRYKPGNLSRSSRFILPHQPRLDWQMWFAALGTFHRNPWLIALSYRLLQGEKEVMDLLDTQNNPFNDKPPKYVRALLYTYKFTSHDESNWWTREEKGEYLPIYTLDHSPLVEYLKERSIIGRQPEVVSNLQLMEFLNWIKENSKSVEPHVLVWTVSWMAFPLSLQALRGGIP